MGRIGGRGRLKKFYNIEHNWLHVNVDFVPTVDRLRDAMDRSVDVGGVGLPVLRRRNDSLQAFIQTHFLQRRT